MISKSQLENRKNWAFLNADVIALSVWWVQILAKRYIKIWYMLWLLKHLETNRDIFQCAHPVLRQEIARSSGLIVNKEFIICCQDSCTRMRWRGHMMDMNYWIWKWIVLYYLLSHCSVISSYHLRKSPGSAQVWKNNESKNLNQTRLRLSIDSIH